MSTEMTSHGAQPITGYSNSSSNSNSLGGTPEFFAPICGSQRCELTYTLSSRAPVQVVFLSAPFVALKTPCHVISRRWITDRLTITPVAGRV